MGIKSENTLRSKGTKKPTKSKLIKKRVTKKKKATNTTRDRWYRQSVRNTKKKPRKKNVSVVQEPRLIASRGLDYRYKSSKDRWLIVELREEYSLKEIYDVVEKHILSTMGSDVEYFLPIYSERINDKSACALLFEGYAFIMQTPAVEDISHKMKSEHIKGFLSRNKDYVHVTSRDINKFRRDLKKKINSMVPRKGQRVVPQVGVFKDLEGKVLSVDRAKLIATVVFEKPSRIVEAPINVINLGTMVSY
jgi:transcription antitermination factor NusG